MTLGTAPEAWFYFFDSMSFEVAIRNSISIGGDSDTIDCIAGGGAEAFSGGVPREIADRALSALYSDLLSMFRRFFQAYMPSNTS